MSQNSKGNAGEVNIVRGAHTTGIIQMVSCNSSLSPGQISEARPSINQCLFFQLYKNKTSCIAEERVKEIEGQGYKAIFLTVDAVIAGNRERDIRVPFVLQDTLRAVATETTDNTASRVEDGVVSEETVNESVEDGGTAGALLQNDDLDMTWTKVSYL